MTFKIVYVKNYNNTITTTVVMVLFYYTYGNVLLGRDNYRTRVTQSLIQSTDISRCRVIKRNCSIYNGGCQSHYFKYYKLKLFRTVCP